MKKRFLILNEFSDPGCPVTKMALDLGEHLKRSDAIPVQLFVSQKYLPGGLQFERILNLLKMHFLVPWWFLTFKWAAFRQKEMLSVLVTTLPPLIHWSAIFWGRVFFIPVTVWYQDGHPELESLLLHARGMKILSALIRQLDFFFLKMGQTFVALDRTMAHFLKARVRSSAQVNVVPPWVTYVAPGLPLKAPPQKGLIRCVYAGNYGFAHDLSPLANILTEIPANLIERLEISFVGMNEQAATKLQNLFAGRVKTSFYPRFKKFDDLTQFLTTFDFGLVSLREELVGISCPSKAYTYLSLGVPVLYSGPANTLSDELCQKGWGFRLSKNTLISLLQYNYGAHLRSGEILEDPQIEGKTNITRYIFAHA